jgi:hypothetical protein
MTMWEQYKKTIKPVQGFIFAVSGVAWYSSHHWEAALGVFLPLQFFAVYGAMWGVRLRSKVLRAGTVPTRQT